MKKIIILLILILSILFLYGRFVEVNNFKVREYSVIDNRLPDSFNGYKIIHISDIFYNGNDLANIIDRINILKPDLVVITGDLLKNNISKDNQNKIIGYINSINSKYGIYYVLGDNDYGDSFDYVINKLNVKVLDNSYVYLYNGNNDKIMLLGIGKELNNDNLFNYDDNDYYKILIGHKPDVFDELIIKENDYINLYLTGHSLNGQIRIPFVGGIIYKDSAKKYHDLEYTVYNTKIYITNGLGNESYDIRLFNTPSINFYRLNNN